MFTGLLSVGFLGRRLRYFQWIGIGTVLAGLVIVGLSDFISSDNTNSDINGVITGKSKENIAQNYVELNPRANVRLRMK